MTSDSKKDSQPESGASKSTPADKAEHTKPSETGNRSGTKPRDGAADKSHDGESGSKA